MNKQPRALRLADALDQFHNPWDKKAAAELRRLHEVNQELVEALEMCLDNPWREGTVQYDALIHEAKVVLAKAKGEA